MIPLLMLKLSFSISLIFPFTFTNARSNDYEKKHSKLSPNTLLDWRQSMNTRTWSISTKEDKLNSMLNDEAYDDRMSGNHITLWAPRLNLHHHLLRHPRLVVSIQFLIIPSKGASFIIIPNNSHLLNPLVNEKDSLTIFLPFVLEQHQPYGPNKRSIERG